MATNARPRRRDDGADLVDAYVNGLLDRGRAPSTVYLYRHTLDAWLRFIGKHPADATLDQVRRFMSRPRVRQGHGNIGAAATQRRELIALRGFYAYCLTVPHRSGVKASPCELAEAPTVKNKHPKAIERGLWRRVWFADSLTDAERAFLGVGFFCGFRREEITSLRLAHIDWPTMRFNGFPRKGGGDDSFPFGSAVALFAERAPELIGTADVFLDPLYRLAMRDRARGFVLPWADTRPSYFRRDLRVRIEAGQSHPNVVNTRLRSLLTRLGESLTAFSPHALRHSFVTYLLDSGVPLHEVSALANHSDVSVTMRYVKIGTDPLAKYHGGLAWQPPSRGDAA